jgi:carbon monoxide dehydrogenase subunit G
MLRFDGQKDFPRLLPTALWDKLSDARFLVQCVPDVHQISSQDREQAAFVLRPGFAFVRGTLDVTMRIVEAVSPGSVRILLNSKGIGTSSEVETTLTLSALEAGTRVNWVAEVKHLGGLLKAIPQGLIRGAAQKVVQDAWNAVEARLAQEAARMLFRLVSWA